MILTQPRQHMTATQPDQQQGLAAVPVAARFLSVSPNHLYQMINSGAIPSKRYGRSVRIPWAWLHAQAAADQE